MGEQYKPQGKSHCPQCGKVIEQSDSNLPFCSSRCKLLDLGAWSSERYRIAAVEQENESEEIEQ
jgi:uncharacterized protein